MPVVKTNLLLPDQYLSSSDNLQIYNGLDTMITFEVHESLNRLFNREPEIYAFERALQGPLLEVMLRGFRVDERARLEALYKLRGKGVTDGQAEGGELKRLQYILSRYAQAVWGRGLNPRSFPQMKDFFYGALGLPEIWISEKGVRKLSFKREVLEKLEVYWHAMPIIATIIAIRETLKIIETLETEVDNDHRLRTSYNIAGTNEDRLSSSYNAFGSGGNLQNVTELLRNIFVADPDYKLCVIDLEQADSREVGWLCWRLFDDSSYLDACESGDLHTLTAKLVWPNLPWPGDKKGDRALADAPFYRHFSRRDMSKRGGHATNFFGKPFTIARHMKVETQLIQDFQEVYLVKAFPCIPRLHRWTAQEIQTTHRLETSFGRERHFFGRPDDEATLREALAFLAASPTAIRTNLGLLRHWQHFKTDTQLLAQTHDSITFQYHKRFLKDEPDIIATSLKLMETPLHHKGRSMVVPGEAKVGWNWQDPGKLPPKIRPVNPDGLQKWKGKDERERVRGLE